MYQAPVYDQGQMNQGGEENAMQPQMMNQQGDQLYHMQPQMMNQQQAPVDTIAEAKAILGLDKIEEQMLAQTAAMEAQRQQAILNEMKAKFPDVSDDAVKKEIERIAKVDPVLADKIQKSASGLEMVYKSIIASSKPTETPDNVIDSDGTGIANQSLESKIKSGKANQFELGDYILGLNK